MKAIQLYKTGNPDVLKITEVAEPYPQKGQVQVSLQFIGINYAEILSRKGLYGWAPKRPYILGMEGSGTITTVGADVDPKRIGEKVNVATQYGCYAEKVVVPSEIAVPAIPFYSMQENAAFLVNYMTAWVSLFEIARLRKSEKVLITAAAGGVGSAAIQLTSKFGCPVFGLAGSDEKIKLIESLGAEKGFNYRKADYFQRLKNYTGGIDVVLEMVGGKIYKNNLKLLNPYGRIIIAGFASLNLKKWNPYSWWKTWRDLPKVSVIGLSMKSNGVLATHLGYLLDDPVKLAAIYNDLKNFVSEHNVKPVIGKIFLFEQITEAHHFIESRGSTGKVLLSLSSV